MKVKVKNVIKDLIRQDQIKDFEYDEVRTNFVSLPRTSVKIHSDSWTKITARETLKKKQQQELKLWPFPSELDSSLVCVLGIHCQAKKDLCFNMSTL